MADTETTLSAPQFVDELPKSRRGRNAAEAGVWSERLAPLKEHPDRWALVHIVEGKDKEGNPKTPYAAVNNLKRGLAAGINPDEFDFAARMIDHPTDEDYEGQVGAVFAQYVSEDRRPELIAERRQRAEKLAASRAKNKAEAEAEDEDE